MAEFNDRIKAQRSILKVINSKSRKEELFGLSELAISRWINANNIKDNVLISFVYKSGDKLFFLANKSQEQVTDDYVILVNEIKLIAQKIKKHLDSNIFM